MKYNFKFEKHVIILTGNIGSGKSTFVKTKQDEYITVCRDALRYNIGNGGYVFDTRFEKEIAYINDFAVQQFMETGVNIIIDEVNINRRLRMAYINYAKMNGYKITSVILKRLSKEECVSRRMNDPHGQPDAEMWGSVWERFNNAYEEPSLDEGFDEIIKL